MTAERFDAILNLVDKILEKSTDGSYPVDVYSIVKILGGEISFKKEKEENISEYKSIVQLNDPYRFEILMLASDDSRSLIKRYDIARCLGYLFLHTKYVDGGFQEVCEAYPSTLLGPYDVDAFAMAILMPKDHFLEVASKNMIGSKYNIEVISNYFQVPREIARNYGIKLGTYRWCRYL